jgi:hypothetical protein
MHIRGKINYQLTADITSLNEESLKSEERTLQKNVYCLKHPQLNSDLTAHSDFLFPVTM